MATSVLAKVLNGCHASVLLSTLTLKKHWGWSSDPTIVVCDDAILDRSDLHNHGHGDALQAVLFSSETVMGRLGLLAVNLRVMLYETA